VESEILVLALAVLAFGMLAGRLEGSPLTMPMLFTALGLVLAPGALGVLQIDVGNEEVSVLAEATLAVVLFTDASRMDLRTVARHHALAQRMLVLGLPLAIVAGTGVGLLLFPDLPVAAAALLAATLAPTDAALGQAFVTNEAVPSEIRQTLNVESGLNDGLVVPFIIVLLDIARHATGSVLGYVELFASLVGIGVAVGVLVGGLGGRLLAGATARGLTTASAQRLATIALAAVAFVGSELLGGNGFVAAFVAGLVVGTAARSLLSETTAFVEAEGQLLTLITFLLFGTIVVVDVLGELSWQIVAYALASLLVVRPVVIALSLLGSGASAATVAFLGWAGPRGLASIVYAVLIAETAAVPGREVVFLVAAWTILLSIYLHGMTAAPLSVAYGGYVDRTRAVEGRRPSAMPELPVRLPPQRGRQAAARSRGSTGTPR